jgi:hypothetical protein
MTTFPITRMTLYKHGVGFFERRANVTGEAVDLSFRVQEMNDVLKSLTAIDWGDGQVLGIEYATPQSREERLAGCSIRLKDDRSLRDLLVGLRGRPVTLHLDQGETAVGLLLGLDELPERQPVGDSLVSLLQAENRVETVPLTRVQGVTIDDERGAADLRFFLQVAQTQEDYRQVTIRLTPGEHDLAVSYIAPAPTWRVSYRLVADPDGDDGPVALLMGWGIFDNRLEEALEEIDLSLVAGMPISFIYDLYTPFTPERPVVEEEARVAAAPIAFAGSTKSMAALAEPEARALTMRRAAMAPVAESFRGDALEATTAVQTSGQSLGELFQYRIDTPVSVGRGQSAMVPILMTRLPYRKELIYNGAKLPDHPVATLRLENKTELTLERGPITVIEADEYVGEAILPFTAVDAELLIAYAVELGATVHENSGTRREIHSLSLKAAYLLVEEWEIEWRDYQINNSTNRALTVLVEQPRRTDYDLFDTPKPAEQTAETNRFTVAVAPQGETTLRVQQRRLRRRQEQIERQSYANLRHYLQKGLIDRSTHDQIAAILGLVEKISEQKQRLDTLDKRREQGHEEQKQIRDNMRALGSSGKEGEVRTEYVARLEKSQQQLDRVAQEETAVQAEITRLEEELAALIAK